MTTEKLESAPDQHFEVTDDSEAKVLLLQLGILNKFTNKLPPHETVQAVTYGEHSTHHILAVLYSGYSNPTQNGYLVYCLPRSEFTQQQFRTFADKFLSPTPDNILGVQAFGGPPKNN